jgi:hypothetical protein
MVVDNSRSGRPHTAVTNVNTDKTEHLLEEDRRVLLSELSWQFKCVLERVHHIIRLALGTNQVCAMWVPHKLNDEEKKSV